MAVARVRETDRPGRVRERGDRPIRVRESSDYGAARTQLSPAQVARIESLNAQAKQVGTASDSGGGGFRSVLGNFGKDVVDVAVSVPSALVFGAQQASVLGAAPYAGSGLPGSGAALRYTKRRGSDARKFVSATGADYSYRYGPLFQGDLDTLRKRSAEHPGLLLLDVGAAWSGAGTAVRLGAAGAGAAAGSRAITLGSARYRAPRERTLTLGPESGANRRGEGTLTVSISRRPYSANPLTRGIQRRADPVIAKATTGLERWADEQGGLFTAVGETRRTQRAAGRQARDLRQAREYDRQRAVRDLSQGYIATARKAKVFRSGPTQAALYLHLRDLLDVPGKTPTQARADVVAFMRSGLEEMQASTGAKGKRARQTIEAIEAVDEDLLDLSKARPEFRKAVEEARALSNTATAKRVEAGTIAPETAQAAARRAAEMVHGGARFDRQSGEWTPPARDDLGRNAAYVPDVAVDVLSKSRRGDSGNAFGRLTQDRVRQSHGVLLGMGNVSMSPGLPIRALERAMVDELHPRFAREFVERFALRRPDRSLARGKRAVLAMEADEDGIALVSLHSLEDSMRLGRELPEGQMPDSPAQNLVAFEGKQGLAAARELPPAKRGELIAVPKDVLDGIRGGYTQPGRVPLYDSGLSLWRRGILAFAPRWYLNGLFGNTLIYGLLTGGDLRALAAARSKRPEAKAVPERVTGVGVVAEARLNEAAPRPGDKKTRGRQRYERASDRGMEFNHRLESFVRRAAYISRTKKMLHESEVNVRTLTPEQVARAMEEAPGEIKDAAIRDVERFLGDYVRLEPWERTWMKRVFPFYSWMRVIGLLMASLPVSHPKRTAVSAAVTQAATEVVNPLDEVLPLFARARIPLPGGWALPTFAANPFASHAELVSAVASGSFPNMIGSLSRDISPIGGQQAAQYISGRNFTGRAFSAPPGYGGTAQSFGGPPLKRNPATGQVDEQVIAPPLSEMLFQTLPLVPGLVRGTATPQGRRPYDTTSTWDLVRYRLGGGGDPAQLLRPRFDEPGAREPVPYAAPFLGLLGLNVHKRNTEAEQRLYDNSVRRLEEAQEQTRKRLEALRARELSR